MSRNRTRCGQSLLDYATLMAIVCVALAGAAVYAKRAVQGRFKEGVDTIGEQFSPRWSNYTYTTTSNVRQRSQLATNGARATLDLNDAVTNTSGFVDAFSNKRLTDEALYE